MSRHRGGATSADKMMDTFSAMQQCLSRRGGSTVAEIAAAIGMTERTALRYLERFARKGINLHHDEATGRWKYAKPGQILTIKNPDLPLLADM